METISVSELKAKLSAQLRKVEAGQSLLVVDHRHPVARLVPIHPSETWFRPAKAPPHLETLSPLIAHDPLSELALERDDRW